MSFRALASLNSPPLVTGAGVALVAGLTIVPPVGSLLGVGALQVANIVAFGTNVVAVSVPGRMDGDQDARMRGGNLNPNPKATTAPLTKTISDSQGEYNIVRASRERTLVAPAGWAFAIWGPIYLGEAVFCAAQYLDPSVLAAVPTVTAPFVVANLTQSLWCASFRPSYCHGWHKYVSVLMLGGTAISLSQLPFAAMAGNPYMIPLVMHFGWTTAATLVNLNGSLAMNYDDVSERILIGVGHASSVVATALGVGVTLTYNLPAYGLTIAWALAGCASGMRVKANDTTTISEDFKEGAKVQKILLATGSLLSAGSAIYTWLYL